MSCLATFTDGETPFIYVDIPAPSKNIILAGSPEQAPTSEAPSTCSSVTAYKSRSRVRHRALITDRGSAITGSIEATLQLTHLINEIRGATKSPEKAERRKQVEALLNLLEFNGKNRPFHLTSMANTLLLEPGLHFSLDQYALFCMTIPSNQMQLALDQLDRDNKDWARRAKINKNAKRQLDFSKPVYHVTTIQVVVLHPSFQPNTMPLLILDSGARRAHGGDAEFDDWKLYRSNFSNSSSLVDRQGNDLSLAWRTSRNDDERLSLFALVVNSYNKLRAARNRTAIAPLFSEQARLFKLWEDTKCMMKRIFFLPPEVEAPRAEGTPAPVSTLSSTSATEDVDACPPTASTLAESSHSMDIDSSRTESLPSSSSFTHIAGFTMDSDDEFDDDDDEEDGYPCPETQAPMTAAEIETSFHRASNSKLTSEERIESAMLLFGMAGSAREPP